jgi:hypothetical protein
MKDRMEAENREDMDTVVISLEEAFVGEMVQMTGKSHLDKLCEY